MSNNGKQLFRSKVGPWGQLEYYYTHLDSPETFFTQGARRESTWWAFDELDRPGVERRLMELGFSEEEMAMLSPPSRWKSASDMDALVVEPPDDLVRSLSRELRRDLYVELNKHRSGRMLANGFRIERGCYRETAEEMGLPDEVIEQVEALSFLMGNTVCFHDSPVVLRTISDSEVKARFLKSLTRTRTLIVRLRVDGEQDFDRIARYWTGGPNRLRMLPMLRNTRRTRGVDSIDLVHLLPPVPRKLLYTYAQRRDMIGGSRPDCYWASMNFFGHFASSRHLDELPRQFYLSEDFVPVEPPLEFGDVCVIHDPARQEFLHSYVYIADDIVYTKNGSNQLFPFVLMKLDDMLSRYSERENIDTHYYRLRLDR